MSIYIQMLRLSEVVVVSNVSRLLVCMIEMMYQITSVTDNRAFRNAGDMSLAVYLKAIDTCSTGAETTHQTKDMTSKDYCCVTTLQAATDSGLFLCAQ